MQKKEKKNLEDFNLPQLNILLKHLRAGEEHLNFLLTPKQLTELFNWCDSNINQKEEIFSDKIEMLGNMSLIINTILTSTFGAWLGLSGCIGYTPGSPKMLTFISILAFFVSSLIGYVSLQTTKNQVRSAIRKQRIDLLQLHILKIINEKIAMKIHSVAFYLNTAVFILENKKEEIDEESNHLNLFNYPSETYQWFEKLTNVLNFRLSQVNDSTSAEIYQKQINQMCFLIKKTLAKHVNFFESLALSKQNKAKRLQMMSALPVLKILTNPSYDIPSYPLSHSTSWIKGHFKQLLLGMVPTIWGSFASMFVFVGGIPTIANELKFLWLAALLTTPFARLIEITMAALVTCYFAFAFLYSSRKSWEREQLLDKIEKEIINEETCLLENSHKLDMLYKVKMHTQKLISIFTVVKKIDQNITRDPLLDAELT